MDQKRVITENKIRMDEIKEDTRLTNSKGLSNFKNTESQSTNEIFEHQTPKPQKKQRNSNVSRPKTSHNKIIDTVNENIICCEGMIPNCRPHIPKEFLQYLNGNM